MKVIDTDIMEVKVIEPIIFSDNRGFFYENFQSERYREIIGKDENFVQDNVSFSNHYTLRGLHFQSQNIQGKLVSVLQGSVFDVAVDVRLGSPTFSKYVGVELSAENKRQLWVPKGFAHGFLVLSEKALFTYKCTNYYDPTAEKTILWSDPQLSINWQLGSKLPVISKKDSEGRTLKDFLAIELPLYQE